MKIIYFIILAFLFNNLEGQELVSITNNNTCINDCTGSIEITVDQSQLDPSMILPFDIEVTNLETEEYKNYTMNDYNYVIETVCKGQYEVLIHLSEYCTWTGNVEVAETNQTLSLTATVVPATLESQCENGSIDLQVEGAQPPFDYYWEYNGHNAGNAEDLSNCREGKYCVTVVDNFCGNTSQCWEVKCTPCPALIIGIQHYGFIECMGKKGKLTVIPDDEEGAPPFTYAWSNGASTATIDNLDPGIYTVTVTDSRDCVSSMSINLYVKNPPIQLFEDEDLVVVDDCHTSSPSGSITFRSPLGAGYTYSWSGPNGFTSTSADISGLSPGEYCVEVRSTSNPDCVYALGCATVQVNNGPEIKLTQKKNIKLCKSNSSCTGSLTIEVPQGASIEWSNIPHVYQEHSTTVTDLCQGSYTVEVCHVGCCNTATYTIECCTSLDDSNSDYDPISGSGQAYSNNGSIQIFISGGWPPYNIYWTGPNGFTSTNQNLSGLGYGTYCVKVFDGCSEWSDCFEIVNCALSGLSVNGTVVNACQGYCYGSISASVSGGKTPYKYLWSNGSVSASISDLCQGSYCVTVTDKSGCTATNCFGVGLNSFVTTRNGCVFTTKCNNIVVNVNDIGSYSVIRSSDCRYIDNYCNDGVYLGSTYAGTSYQIVSNCRVDEICNSNGSIYRTHFGVQSSTILRGFDSERRCWWCHTVSFCRFPTLGNWINPNSIVFMPIGTGFQYSTLNNGCNLSNTETGCLHKIWCNGQVISTFCTSMPCFFTEVPCIDGLGLKYDVSSETMFNEDGNIETIQNYVLTNFDTAAVLDFIKFEIDSLENKLIKNNFLTKDKSSLFLYKSNKSIGDNNAISIYPNPALDEFTIKFDTKVIKETVKLEILEVTGNLLSRINIENSQTGIASIPISHLSDGLYIIRLRSSINNQIIFSSKIIKNSK